MLRPKALVLAASTFGEACWVVNRATLFSWGLGSSREQQSFIQITAQNYIKRQHLLSFLHVGPPDCQQVPSRTRSPEGRSNTNSQRQQRHLKALRKSRGLMNIKKPKELRFLRDRQKQKYFKEVKNNEIQRENQQLLRKLVKIDKQKGRLNPLVISNNYNIPSTTTIQVNDRLRERKVDDENTVSKSYPSDQILISRP